MTNKIFRSILLASLAVLLASLVIIMGCLYGYFSDVQEKQLKDELNLAAVAVEEQGESYLSKVNSENYRITWIKANGEVIYDTKADAAEMENHSNREEIQEAFAYGSGESARYSDTLLEKTMYYAKKLSDGSVLRFSASQATVWVLVIGLIQPILVVFLIALLLSIFLAKRLAGRIVEPLNELDLEHPLENDVYEEISPLLVRINSQHEQIAEQLGQLQQKNDEFDQITGSMKEGLVLLNKKGNILSINPAAQSLFKTGRYAVGKDFLAIDRSHDLTQAVRQALAEGHSEIRLERNGRQYQFDISRIESKGEVLGSVLLAFDVTEQENAERNRREFTANVSHELKTPLQSIIGSAELIENGLVKKEDMPRFIGHIHKEAARLVTLIDDIIRLSQLDEGAEMPMEEVDLYEVAREAVNSLQDAADSKNISLTLSGEKHLVHGVYRLLHEIVYNLCDNAIKYNNKGGKVEVKVEGDAGKTILTVKDNGIGIPLEHQDRIFERFYRVDKSHSKASGGTGLGLSIVKHGVKYHHGKIELKSTEGKGTTITVQFPLQ